MLPVAASTSQAAFLPPLKLYDAAAITPPPLSAGLPRITPGSPVSQMGAPVDGSSCRSDPEKAVPPIVVPLPATNSREPSQIAAGRQRPGPTFEALPTW